MCFSGIRITLLRLRSGQASVTRYSERIGTGVDCRGIIHLPFTYSFCAMFFASTSNA